MKKKILGIIGGAGVAATNKLNMLIEKKCTQNGAYRDAHHPQVIVFQATQAPSRSMFLEGKGESFVQDYINVGMKLKEIGATELCMACNTAHYSIEILKEKIGLPFIDMIQETVLQVKKQKTKKIGIIASDGCIKGKVYEKYFSKICSDKELIYPISSWQEEVTRGIKLVKTSRRVNSIDVFKNVCDHLVDDLGVEVIVLGCTDISVCFTKSAYKRVPIIESLDVLAEKIYSDYYVELPGNKCAKEFFDNLSSDIVKPEETKNKSLDSSDIDAKFINKYSGNGKKLLDFGSGTGLILNKIYHNFSRIVAVERCLGLSKFIVKAPNIEILNQDMLELNIGERFDVVSIFAVMNYFNKQEARKVYSKVFPLVKSAGILIVKHQMGVNETVNVNGYSKELGKYYFSQYRTLDEEMEILNECGFLDIRVFDIYPEEYNRWDNTHYYALVCYKS